MYHENSNIRICSSEWKMHPKISYKPSASVNCHTQLKNLYFYFLCLKWNLWFNKLTCYWSYILYSAVWKPLSLSSSVLHLITHFHIFGGKANCMLIWRKKMFCPEELDYHIGKCITTAFTVGMWIALISFYKLCSDHGLLACQLIWVFMMTQTRPFLVHRSSCQRREWNWQTLMWT